MMLRFLLRKPPQTLPTYQEALSQITALLTISPRATLLLKNMQQIRIATHPLQRWLACTYNLLTAGAYRARLLHLLNQFFYLFFHGYFNPLNLPLHQRLFTKKLQIGKRLLQKLSAHLPSQFLEISLSRKLKKFETVSLLQKQLIKTAEQAARRTAAHPWKKALQAALQMPFKPHHMPRLILRGCSGTYLLRDSESQRAAIFKPMDESIHGPHNPSGARFQNSLGVRIARSGLRTGECVFREYAAYLVDQFFDLRLVPYTILTTLSSRFFFLRHDPLCRQKKPRHKFGSLQRYVEGTALALTEAETIAKVSRDQVQRLALLDVIIGNTDRHAHNVLVHKNRLIALDHGLSFCDDHQGIFWQWQAWPQAQFPFSPFWKEKLLDFSVDRLLQQLHTSAHIRLECLKRAEERIALLRTALHEECLLTHLSRRLQVTHV